MSTYLYKRQLISLLNFNPSNYNYPNISSPRSQKVMQQHGIAPSELFRVPKDILAKMFAKGKSINGDTLAAFEQHYEYKRQSKVNTLLKERDTLIELEKSKLIKQSQSSSYNYLGNTSTQGSTIEQKFLEKFNRRKDMNKQRELNHIRITQESQQKNEQVLIKQQQKEEQRRLQVEEQSIQQEEKRVYQENLKRQKEQDEQARIKQQQDIQHQRELDKQIKDQIEDQERKQGAQEKDAERREKKVQSEKLSIAKDKAVAQQYQIKKEEDQNKEEKRQRYFDQLQENRQQMSSHRAQSAKERLSVTKNHQHNKEENQRKQYQAKQQKNENMQQKFENQQQQKLQMIIEMNQEKKDQIDRAQKMKIDDQEHFRVDYWNKQEERDQRVSSNNVTDRMLIRQQEQLANRKDHIAYVSKNNESIMLKKRQSIIEKLAHQDSMIEKRSVQTGKEREEQQVLKLMKKWDQEQQIKHQIQQDVHRRQQLGEKMIDVDRRLNEKKTESDRVFAMREQATRQDKLDREKLMK